MPQLLGEDPGGQEAGETANEEGPIAIAIVLSARDPGRLRERVAQLDAWLVAVEGRAWADGALPAPVAAVHVRAAATTLDELIGTVDTDELFARVFATFCVGK